MALSSGVGRIECGQGLSVVVEDPDLIVLSQEQILSIGSPRPAAQREVRKIAARFGATHDAAAWIANGDLAAGIAVDDFGFAVAVSVDDLHVPDVSVRF